MSWMLAFLYWMCKNTHVILSLALNKLSGEREECLTISHAMIQAA